MTRAASVTAAQRQITALAMAVAAVKHDWTDRPAQPAYRSHTASIDLTVAFPGAHNPTDFEHIRAALDQLADIVPNTAQLTLSGVQIYASWQEAIR